MTEAALVKGEVIGAREDGHGWVIGEIIGDGSFGVVYAVEHSYSGKLGACKLLRASTRGVGKQARDLRLKNEKAARLLAVTKHPHLVEVFDAGIDEGINDGDPPRQWVVMERLEGESLAQLLAGRGPLQPQQAIEYIYAAASAVALVAAQGVVHRDLKPDNLHISTQNQLKVLDFDGAKMRAAPTLVENSITGTPSYMSPEHYEAADLDSRADVWALGIILYEMLVGRLPFSGGNIQELHASITHQDLPDPEETLPEPIWKIIKRATEKDRNKRFGSMNDFAAALQKLRHNPSSGGVAVNYAETTRLSAEHFTSGADPSAQSTQTAYASPQAPSPPQQQLTVGVGMLASVAVGAIGIAVVVVVATVSWMNSNNEAAQLPPPIPVTAAPTPAVVIPPTPAPSTPSSASMPTSSAPPPPPTQTNPLPTPRPSPLPRPAPPKPDPAGSTPGITF